MPTKPNGDLGSFDYTKEEHWILAIKSHDVASKFGTPKHQTSIDSVEQNKFPQVVWLQ